jgi:hypothetical protein
MGRAALCQAADRFAEDLAPVIETIRSEGTNTLRSMAAELNRRGFKSARGGQWHPSSVANLLSRLTILYRWEIRLTQPAALLQTTMATEAERMLSLEAYKWPPSSNALSRRTNSSKCDKRAMQLWACLSQCIDKTKFINGRDVGEKQLWKS